MVQKILLVDGYAMMFRSFYAVKFQPMFEGKTVNAVYGCTTTLFQALETFNPEAVIVAFDAPEKTFRHEADSDYKAQREAAPDEFIAQIPLVFELIEAFGIPTLIKPGFEADDIIGTIAHKAANQNIDATILSGDLDFLQLISDKIHLAKFNGKTPDIYDRAKTVEKLGIEPEQIIDYKAICGDSSDNYKGVQGVGPKGAVKLLTQYKTLDGIYTHLEELPVKLRAKFEEHKSYAYHCQHLATISLTVPTEYNFPKEVYDINYQTLIPFLEKIGFKSLVTRAKNLNNKIDQTITKEPNLDTKKADIEDQMSLF